ncbi:2-phospho-L-lactate guanylyltransferase [Halorhabdus sp. CBA1104]|uniref:2-phospho-L-lactate guanylyltransferase n=1 Tax=unclassified Halorhabdus TaxID=2621901 RepID=UPI0012B1B1B4|nr:MULTISPECIES: 2-phospho-L-lactate guanylyltransferase [unclassified Halorhabdus]QGN07431.1 2-phospho-L-lactate guanylyltransferase [Halorhabdus sp. CBA1104]
MRVFVPFDASDPKTRLTSILSPAERSSFARSMCRDVVRAVRAAGGQPELIATDSIDSDAPVTVDDRPLSAAVNARLREIDEPAAVIVADLALVTPAAIERLFAADSGVVLAPGRGGGTNAIVARHPDFRVDYHDASIRDHRAIAADVGADVTEVDSYRLATDVDEPADLAEVLLHGQGEAVAWLREAGFELAVESGRVGVER